MAFDDDRKIPRGEDTYFAFFYGTNLEQVDWDDRVKSWSPLSRSIETWEGKFRIGDFSVTFADHDQALLGSFNDKSPINRKFQFRMSFDDSDWKKLFTGKIQGRVDANNEITLDIKDLSSEIKNAKFVWDYQNFGTEISGVSYGLVGSVWGGGQGSTIVINDGYGTKHIALFGLQHWRRRSMRIVRSFYDLNIIPDDSLVEGDFIKFHSASFASDEAGATLADTPYYKVVSGTWIANKGTISFDRELEGVNEGDSVYVRQDLEFEGNPGQIVYDILTGTNSNASIQDSDFDKTVWGVGTNVLNPLNFYKYITEEKEGAVVKEIEKICESALINFFIDEDGQIVVKPWQPLKLPDAAELYDEADQIEQQSFSLTHNIEDIYTRAKVRYGYDRSAPDDDSKFAGEVERSFDSAATKFDYLTKTRILDSEWLKYKEDSIVIADRILGRHKDGLKRASFKTSLHGLGATLGEIIKITHRTGDLSAHWFEVVGYNRDLGNKRVGLDAIDAEEIYQGYAWWGINSDTDTDYGGLANTVTSTSCSGWGSRHHWQTPFDHTVNPCPIYGTGTVKEMNVGRYGSHGFKWW